MKQAIFVTILVLTAAFMGVCWGQSAILDAFQGLDDGLKTAFNALGPNLLTELDDASKCIVGQLSYINRCNFNTSFDPFYYIQTCLKGTTVQQLVENFVRSVPVANLSFGVPQRVSNDRCDCDLVPTPSCFVRPPTLPPLTVLPPPSIFGGLKQ